MTTHICAAGAAVRSNFLFRVFSYVVVAMLAVGVAVPAQANPLYAAYVLDVKSGKTLFDRNADQLRHPASLTKMMTLYLLFEKLDAGEIKLTDRITVSANAASMPRTKLGIKAGGTIRVEDAIKSLITRSANDIALAIGEHLAGDEVSFGKMATAKAHQLGMVSTVFRNASGLHHSKQVTTAHDMALLGIALNQHFPEYYAYFQTRSFRFGKETIGNHNRLLGSVDGVDGIKTGFIYASGFNLVTSIRRDGRQLIAVVLGGRTAQTRDAHMRDLIGTYLQEASETEISPVIIPRPGVPADDLPIMAADEPIPAAAETEASDVEADIPDLDVEARVRTLEPLHAASAPTRIEQKVAF